MNAAELDSETLRRGLLSKVQAMRAADLTLVHRVLLQIEKERLWGEISEEAEEDRRKGLFDDLPRLLAEARRSPGVQ